MFEGMYFFEIFVLNFPLTVFHQVLKSYEDTLDAGRTITYEDSEMLLYKNLVIEESGDIAGALSNLATIEPQVRDKQTLLEKRGSFQLQLGQ